MNLHAWHSITDNRLISSATLGNLARTPRGRTVLPLEKTCPASRTLPREGDAHHGIDPTATHPPSPQALAMKLVPVVLNYALPTLGVIALVAPHIVHAWLGRRALEKCHQDDVPEITQTLASWQATRRPSIRMIFRPKRPDREYSNNSANTLHECSRI